MNFKNMYNVIKTQFNTNIKFLKVTLVEDLAQMNLKFFEE